MRYAVSVLPQGLATEFAAIAHGADPDLGVAALLMARVAYPSLDSGRYLEHLDALGRDAQARMVAAPEPDHAMPPHVDPHVFTRVLALNQFLFVDQGFAGNDQHYDDPRNSFLNDVLDRRTGIPITLALVYIEVAKRAGLDLEGVNFPGHFLVRHRGTQGTRYSRDLIIDAHHGGALLSEAMCRDLLSRHLGGESPWDAHLLAHATKLQMLTRMLLNLKRAYVRLHSFEQARDITELLLAVDPTAVTELRDRGLLAYHLNDFGSALRDLQSYLEMSKGADLDESERDEQARIWEHVKTLRKRVASFN